MTTRRLDGRLTARNPASSWTLGAPTYQVMTYTHENREVWQDVLGAVDHLRSGGAEKVIAGGASIGATASLYAAEQSGSDIDG